MKSVELKLLIEGVGTYTLLGKMINGSLKNIDWISMSGDGEIEKEVIINNKPNKNIYLMYEKLMETAKQKYPNRNISTIVNYENTN